MARSLQLLERMINPRAGGFSPEHANYVLSLDFSPKEHARYQELAVKVQDGALTPAETVELDNFLLVNTLLGILKTKARISLRKHPSAA